MEREWGPKDMEIENPGVEGKARQRRMVQKRNMQNKTKPSSDGVVVERTIYEECANTNK
jgi:hypothetical protein